jgi:hypothetical protein
MRHNQLPPILLSALSPEDVVVPRVPGTARIMLACPTCRQTRTLSRSAITPHADPGTGHRCPSSGQRVTVDLDFPSWQHRLAGPRPSREPVRGVWIGRWPAGGRRIDPNARTGQSRHGVSAPPLPLPVCRMAG